MSKKSAMEARVEKMLEEARERVAATEKEILSHQRVLDSEKREVETLEKLLKEAKPDGK